MTEQQRIEQEDLCAQRANAAQTIFIEFLDNAEQDFRVALQNACLEIVMMKEAK
jgi:hypothetical protein